MRRGIIAATNDDGDGSYVTSSGYGAPTASPFNLGVSIPAGSVHLQRHPAHPGAPAQGRRAKCVPWRRRRNKNRLTGGYLASINRPGSGGSPPVLTSWPLQHWLFTVPGERGRDGVHDVHGSDRCTRIRSGRRPCFFVTAYFDLGMRTGPSSRCTSTSYPHPRHRHHHGAVTSPDIADTSRPVIASSMSDPEATDPACSASSTVVGLLRARVSASKQFRYGGRPRLADRDRGRPATTAPATAPARATGTTDLVNGAATGCMRWPRYGGGLVAPVRNGSRVAPSWRRSPSITAAWDPTVGGVPRERDRARQHADRAAGRTRVRGRQGSRWGPTAPLARRV